VIFVSTTPFGASPTGDRQARIEQSPRCHDGEFSNARPQWIDGWSANTEAIFGGEDFSSPDPALRVAPTDSDLLATPPVGGLRLTWIGHSSMLVETDGVRLLVDPFWSAQAGPNSLFGTDRFFPAPSALSDLGPIDAVLISHDHWDHLDQGTIYPMREWTGTTFVVPLGVGADLELWGIPAERIRNWTGGTAPRSGRSNLSPLRHDIHPGETHLSPTRRCGRVGRCADRSILRSNPSNQ
jgi:hypothetical protein